MKLIVAFCKFAVAPKNDIGILKHATCLLYIQSGLCHVLSRVFTCVIHKGNLSNFSVIVLLCLSNQYAFVRLPQDGHTRQPRHSKI
jgi:hypothetical protein